MDTGPNDVSLTITHCGICYADVAWAKNIPRNTIYPVVPGVCIHEIIRIAKEVGSNVRRFKVSDHVVVGPYVNNYKTCEHCKIREEVHCDAETTHTFFPHVGVGSMSAASKSASGDHPFDPYMALLKPSGVLVLVGFPSEVKFNPMSLLTGSGAIFGSVAGGTKDMLEMLDFCATNSIHPEVVIPIQYVNKVLERIENRDVKYQFVIDVKNSFK
ncbi:hypothetical protein GIB67_040884 [Kingdonia uniflora]|uniref:Alcohol dehydrogenase-like N-terminal domain-containing protein n=1 Tax=Kingdonia uniflora TaxID=39325 RepID=A0A7J7L839_9MAGN|nr:hypothetical protein GIB67_040884 [Kingdonia uniflora]